MKNLPIGWVVSKKQMARLVQNDDVLESKIIEVLNQSREDTPAHMLLPRKSAMQAFRPVLIHDFHFLPNGTELSSDQLIRVIQNLKECRPFINFTWSPLLPGLEDSSNFEYKPTATDPYAFKKDLLFLFYRLMDPFDHPKSSIYKAIARHIIRGVSIPLSFYDSSSHLMALSERSLWHWTRRAYTDTLQVLDGLRDLGDLTITGVLSMVVTLQLHGRQNCVLSTWDLCMDLAPLLAVMVQTTRECKLHEFNKLLFLACVWFSTRMRQYEAMLQHVDVLAPSLAQWWTEEASHAVRILSPFSPLLAYILLCKADISRVSGTLFFVSGLCTAYQESVGLPMHEHRSQMMRHLRQLDYNLSSSAASSSSSWFNRLYYNSGSLSPTKEPLTLDVFLQVSHYQTGFFAAPLPLPAIEWLQNTVSGRRSTQAPRIPSNRHKQLAENIEREMVSLCATYHALLLNDTVVREWIRAFQPSIQQAAQYAASATRTFWPNISEFRSSLSISLAKIQSWDTQFSALVSGRTVQNLVIYVKPLPNPTWRAQDDLLENCAYFVKMLRNAGFLLEIFRAHPQSLHAFAPPQDFLSRPHNLTVTWDATSSAQMPLHLQVQLALYQALSPAVGRYVPWHYDVHQAIARQTQPSGFRLFPPENGSIGWLFYACSRLCPHDELKASIYESVVRLERTVWAALERELNDSSPEYLDLLKAEKFTTKSSPMQGLSFAELRHDYFLFNVRSFACLEQALIQHLESHILPFFQKADIEFTDMQRRYKQQSAAVHLDHAKFLMEMMPDFLGTLLAIPEWTSTFSDPALQIEAATEILENIEARSAGFRGNTLCWLRALNAFCAKEACENMRQWTEIAMHPNQILYVLPWSVQNAYLGGFLDVEKSRILYEANKSSFLMVFARFLVDASTTREQFVDWLQHAVAMDVPFQDIQGTVDFVFYFLKPFQRFLDPATVVQWIQTFYPDFAPRPQSVL